MVLGPFTELTINRKWTCLCILRPAHTNPDILNSTENDEIKSLIAARSGIPEENIEYAKVNSEFICRKIKRLDKNLSMFSGERNVPKVVGASA